jgi:hypothetical protein
MAPPSADEFRGTVRTAAAYLEEQGFVCSKSKLSADEKKGLIFRCQDLITYQL